VYSVITLVVIRDAYCSETVEYFLVSAEKTSRATQVATQHCGKFLHPVVKRSIGHKSSSKNPSHADNNSDTMHNHARLLPIPRNSNKYLCK